jgi:hypothetical protein
MIHSTFHGHRAAIRPGRGPREAGVATLIVSLVLLAASTVLTLAVARTGVLEQRVTTNEQRAREAAQAAEAALEFGMASLQVSLPAAWTAAGGGLEQATLTGGSPGVAAGNGDAYNTLVTLTRSTDPTRRSLVRVTATATAAGDGSIAGRAEQWVRRISPLSSDPADSNPPVLMVRGCLGGVTGHPGTIPRGHSAGAVVGPSVGTATTAADDCIDTGHLDLNGGAIGYEAFSGDPWDDVFEMTRAEVQARAAAEVAAGLPASQRTYVWETSAGVYHTSWGSASHPVVVVFSAGAGCPKINGGVTIYGVLFIDGDCPDANGFGGATVNGMVVVNGDLGGLNANMLGAAWGEAGGTSGSSPPFPVRVVRLHGSWRDY